MNLISTLNAGIAAAANGWAEVYIRGTSTRATVYYDFEATTSDSSGDNIDLDAYGAVEVYVNQLVDVVAKSPDGTIIRSWTDGYSSPNVEVISPAFTGNDYVSGASAVNEPTTLQAVLNLWETNNGAPDWKVNIGGTPTTIEDAFGATVGLVFNVKSPEYGAVGDGIVNDQAAIQAALAAAVSAGGGTVYFPVGTYLISTAIDWDHRVNMLGVGAGLSVLTTNSAANARLITFTSGTALGQAISISGMAFSATQVNTGTQLYASVAVNLLVSNCWFGVSTNCTGRLADIAGASSRVTYRGCKFSINGSTNYAATTSTTTAASYINCLFAPTGTSAPSSLLVVQGSSDMVRDCVFDITTVVSAGTYVAIQMGAAAPLSVSGCAFRTAAQVFTSCIGLIGGGGIVVCQGNEFGNLASNQWYSIPASQLSNGSSLQLGNDLTSNTTTPIIPYATGYHTHSSNTTVPTFTVSNGAYRGAELLLILTNTSGAGWVSVGFSGASVQRVTGLTAIDVPNAATVAARFVWQGTQWLLYVKA